MTLKKYQMNKGTREGTEEEISVTRKFNKKLDKEPWSILGLSPENNFAIHIISKKYGKINQGMILPKADIFIASGNVDNDYLKKNNFYLNENDLSIFNLNPLSKTGISIKRSDSKKYQIIKMVPNTFLKVFKSNILAVGASIYCSNPDEFIKNKNILKGWGVSELDFIRYFNKKISKSINSVTEINGKNQLIEIKKYSNVAIKEIINTNKEVSEFIFWGKGNFEEPYTATWLLEKNLLRKNYVIPFEVTTGSGRSKGDFTIVIKPS